MRLVIILIQFTEGDTNSFSNISSSLNFAVFMIRRVLLTALLLSCYSKFRLPFLYFLELYDLMVLFSFMTISPPFHRLVCFCPLARLT